MWKRAFDIVVSAAALLLIAPVFLAVAIAVRVALGRPVLFRQPRPGLHGNPFDMFKFRTMTEARDRQGELLDESLRQTRLGRFLRKTSLDELPQLINVLKGDMSLVGPRPILLEYLPLLDRRYARRHAVRPGITGLAQIRGRQTLTLSRKFDLDLEYAANHSMRLDLEILMKTFAVIISPEGAYEGVSTQTDDLGICPIVAHQRLLSRGGFRPMQYSRQAVPEEAIRELLDRVDQGYAYHMLSKVDNAAFAAKVAVRARCASLWRGKRLIGLAAVYVDEPLNSEAFLTILCVAPEHARKGIGRVLLNMVCRMAREAGKQSLVLHVARDNKCGKRFYEQYGFQKLAESPEALVMRLPLTATLPPRRPSQADLSPRGVSKHRGSSPALTVRN